METIVLDYCDASIIIFKHEDNIDVEEFLIGKGFRLGDCEWMSVNEIKINRK